VADADNTVVETNEADNEYTRTITVLTCPQVTAGTGTNATYACDAVELESIDLFALLTNEDEGGIWTDEAQAVVTSPINIRGWAPGVYTFKYTVTPRGESSVCPGDDELVTITIEPCVCNTAYAYGGIAGNEDQTCFSQGGFSQWGWSNAITAAGTYNWPLYAGAAQCDITKGWGEVGNVQVVYDDIANTLSVTYTITKAGYSMSEVHVYVGCTQYPQKRGKNTVAPGQYTFQATNLDKSTEMTVNFTGVSDDIWVIAHAEVCETRGSETVGAFSKKLNLQCTNKVGSAENVTSNFEGTDLNVYPNPFSDKLHFEFVAASSVNARIDIYDLTGRMVKTVFNNPVEEGVIYNAEFTPVSSVSTMYIYRMMLGEKEFVGKVLYQK
jgi:hypothetical protein